MSSSYPSKDAGWKFANAKACAGRRGIEWQFSFEEWWAWWQTDGRWERRGRGPDKLCMARNGDVGPYAPWNVHCCTGAENQAEITHESYLSRTRKAAETRRNTVGFNLAVRGSAHPRSRPVRTPAGDFESGGLAADHYGVSKQAIYHRVKKGFPGYEWIDAKCVATERSGRNQLA